MNFLNQQKGSISKLLFAPLIILILAIFFLPIATRATLARTENSSAKQEKSIAAVPVTNQFSYQGYLEDGGIGVNGLYDFEFRLFDGPNSGTDIQIGATSIISDVTIVNGIFTVQLDFGAAAFAGEARWLEVSVGPDGGALTALAPLQPLTAVPYALYGEDADADPTNEHNTAVTFDGSNLSVTDAGGSFSADISSLANDGDWVVAGPDMYSSGTLNVGVGTSTPDTQLHVVETNSAPISAVKAEGAFGPTNAYLAVQGDTDHDGIVTLDISGNEIGLLGVSVGSSAADNSGLFGHSNGFGGIFEYANTISVTNRVEIAGSTAALSSYGANGTLNVQLGESSANNGRISVYNNSGNLRAGLFVDTVGDAGGIATYGPNGNLNVQLGENDTNNGLVSLHNSSGNSRVELFVDTDDDAGTISTYGPNGNLNVQLGNMQLGGNAADNGRISLYNNSGLQRVELFVSGTTNNGSVKTYGANGNLNVLAGNLNGYPDHGFAAVADAGGSTWAGMYVDAAGFGVVFGDVKSFRMVHPENPEQEIWYASIEGPEAAAYTRGTAQLINGQAEIQLPDHFTLVINESTMTTILTPRSANSLGLAVVKQSATSIVIQELGGGTGSYLFDWEVKAVRAGFEDFSPVRDQLSFDTHPASQTDINVNQTNPLPQSAEENSDQTESISQPTTPEETDHDLIDQISRLQKENKQLQAQNEAMQSEIEAIKAHLGLDENEAQKEGFAPLNYLSSALLGLFALIFTTKKISNGRS